MTHTPRLILGSASPRRKDTLEQIAFAPDIIHAADIDETPLKNELPRAYCMRITMGKNTALHAQFPHDFIVTADTTCVVGRRIIGKPEDKQDATRILRLLSGRSHQILTAVVVRAPDGRMVSSLNATRVRVKRLSDDEIAWHLTHGQWDAYAGAYHFGGTFARHIRHISGSYSGIIGLPAFDVTQLLQGLGYQGK
jgi:septum formation protein